MGMAQLPIIMIQIKHEEKTKFLWPCPESDMRSRSKWKVCCTSTMIVQLIGIKCVQICKVVWAESRTQSTTPIWNGRTHGHESAKDKNIDIINLFCGVMGAFTSNPGVPNLLADIINYSPFPKVNSSRTIIAHTYTLIKKVEQNGPSPSMSPAP